MYATRVQHPRRSRSAEEERASAAKMIGKAGKAAATVIAASKVVGEMPELARIVGLTARKRSRLTSWLHS